MLACVPPARLSAATTRGGRVTRIVTTTLAGFRQPDGVQWPEPHFPGLTVHDNEWHFRLAQQQILRTAGCYAEP